MNSLQLIWVGDVIKSNYVSDNSEIINRTNKMILLIKCTKIKIYRIAVVRFSVKKKPNIKCTDFNILTKMTIKMQKQ